MGRPRSRLALGIGLLVVVLATTACSARFQATGVVTSVDGSFDDVTSFTVRTTDGDDLSFVVAADGEYAFPVSHLREHLVAGSPIVIEWTEADGVLTATSIDDADEPHG